MKKIVKRVMVVLIVLCIVLSLAACEKSKVDENQRKLDMLHDSAEQAARRAEEARREYDQLQKDWADYERLLGALNGK
jgi:uncharacterized coiled-coil DUF342 family protein